MTGQQRPARAHYDIVLFDLDGTLIDSRIGIHSSVVHTLQVMGAEAVGQDVLSQFIGPPLIDSFQRVCGMSEADAERAVAVYKDYFAVEGIKGYEVYDDVPEMLWLLRASGVAMAIATTKDEVFARHILLEADLLPYFTDVIGSDHEGTMLRKPELIAAALSAVQSAAGVNAPTASPAGAAPPANASPRMAMVGDHGLDVLGAKANGITAIAVAYGFGDLDDIREAGPDHIAESVLELRQLLLGA